jgi:RES domain-containing protein
LVGISVSRAAWFRVHPADKSAIYFGKSANNRFTPKDSPFGVCYAAEDLPTALFEVFGDEMLENDCRLRGWRWMNYRISEIHLPSVSICDLSEDQTRSVLGVDLASLRSPELQIPQEWALAVMNHRAEVDGMQYQSRFTSRRCLALFDRRGIGPHIGAKLLGKLSGLPEANKFLDEYKVLIV